MLGGHFGLNATKAPRSRLDCQTKSVRGELRVFSSTVSRSSMSRRASASVPEKTLQEEEAEDPVEAKRSYGSQPPTESPYSAIKKM